MGTEDACPLAGPSNWKKEAGSARPVDGSTICLGAGVCGGIGGAAVGPLSSATAEATDIRNPTPMKPAKIARRGQAASSRRFTVRPLYALIQPTKPTLGATQHAVVFAAQISKNQRPLDP